MKNVKTPIFLVFFFSVGLAYKQLWPSLLTEKIQELLNGMFAETAIHNEFQLLVSKPLSVPVSISPI